MVKNIALYFAMFCLISTQAYAEHYKKADEFYPRDYAGKPLDNRRLDNGRTKRNIPSENFTEEKNNGDVKVSPSQQGKQDIEEDTRKGKKIAYISVIVNGVDKTHLEKTIQELITVVDKYDIDIGPSYFITPPESDVSMQTRLILARGGVVSFKSYVPHDYNVSISPTWIIQTEEGQIVLEGVTRLSNYVNGHGEFVSDNASPIATN